MNSLNSQKEFIKSQIKILTEPYDLSQFQSNDTSSIKDTQWVRRLNNSIQLQHKMMFNQQGLQQVYQQLSWFSSKQYLAQLWTSKSRWFQYPDIKTAKEKDIYEYIDNLPSTLPCVDTSLTESYQKKCSILQTKLKKFKNLKLQLKEYEKLLNDLNQIIKNKEILKRNLSTNHSKIFEELEQSRQLITHMKNKDLLNKDTLSKDKITNESLAQESEALNRPKLKSLLMKNLPQ